MSELLALVFTEKYLAAGLRQQNELAWLKPGQLRLVPLYFKIEQTPNGSQVLNIDEASYEQAAEDPNYVGHIFDAMSVGKLINLDGSHYGVEDILVDVLQEVKAQYRQTLALENTNGRIPIALCLPDDATDKAKEQLVAFLESGGFDVVQAQGAAAALLANQPGATALVDAIGGTYLQVAVNFGQTLDTDKLLDFNYLATKVALAKLVVDKALRNSFSSLLRDEFAAKNEYRNHLNQADGWLATLQKEGLLNIYVKFSDGETGNAVVRSDEYNSLLFDATSVLARVRDNLAQVAPNQPPSKVLVTGQKLANEVLVGLLGQQFGRDRVVAITNEEAAVRQLMLNLLAQAQPAWQNRQLLRVSPPPAPVAEPVLTPPPAEPVQFFAPPVAEPIEVSAPPMMEPAEILAPPVAEAVAQVEPVPPMEEPTFAEPPPPAPDLFAHLVENLPPVTEPPLPPPPQVGQTVKVEPPPAHPPTYQDTATVRQLLGTEPATYLQEVSLPEYPKAIRKILKEELAKDGAVNESFSQEIKRISYISHPNIAKIYKGVPDAPLPYYLAEYVEGKKLKTLLPLATEAEAKKWIVPILQALDYLHQREFWYKTLKPENIVVRPDGQSPTLVASGLEYVRSNDNKTGIQNKVRVNLKETGSLLLEMLTGKTAPQAIGQVKDKRWAEVIKKTSDGSSASPYKTAGEMLADIEKRFAAGTAKPTPAPAAFPLGKVLAAALAVVLVVGLALAAYLFRDRLMSLVKSDGPTVDRVKKDEKPAQEKKETPSQDNTPAETDVDFGRLANNRYVGKYTNPEGQEVEITVDVQQVNISTNEFVYNLVVHNKGAGGLPTRKFRQGGKLDLAANTLILADENLREFSVTAQSDNRFVLKSKQIPTLELQ
ncbi:MAG: protein kinase [Bernardetiaceae bacterium]|jgi:serine/threonine protein kinase|nr:protein kinase [Bernardetiaceae bacterium]